MFNLKSKYIELPDGDVIDYIELGKGSKNLIMIPGLSDGIQTVRGSSILFSFYYRRLSKHFKLFILSRKRHLEHGCSTKDMAESIVYFIKKLEIQNPNIIGISMGGMILQYIAINHPEVFNKMILVVTLPKADENLQKILKEWIEMVKNKQYFELTKDTIEKTYTEKHLKRYRPMYPFIKMMVKLKDPERFIIQAEACSNHNTIDELNKINKPVYIVGGNKDLIASNNSSETLHKLIKNSKLEIYDGYGHGVFEECKKDFETKVINYFSE